MHRKGRGGEEMGFLPSRGFVTVTLRQRETECTGVTGSSEIM